MLGLRIKVSDTFGFRIRMGRKKGGLLVEMIKHQGNMDVFAEGENVDKMSSWLKRTGKLSKGRTPKN